MKLVTGIDAEGTDPVDGEAIRCRRSRHAHAKQSESKAAALLSRSEAGDRDRTGDIQLGKLTFYR